jgi:hypothetical protein
MGRVGGESSGFDITWVNCGALMEQFFGNDRTMLFVSRMIIGCPTKFSVK